eukprot:355791-Chlamydomonas_euryale.AAC.1
MGEGDGGGPGGRNRHAGRQAYGHRVVLGSVCRSGRRAPAPRMRRLRGSRGRRQRASRRTRATRTGVRHRPAGVVRGGSSTVAMVLE